MSKREWKSGPPPHVGWWMCKDTSTFQGEMWRWWAGKNWSYPASEYDGEVLLLTCARSRAMFRNDEIKWCDYWPEDARVPRVKP